VLTSHEEDIAFDLQKITSVLESFLCNNREYLQTPPMYSAVKVGGKKLYELARRGETIERTPRLVLIHKICIKDFCKENLQKNTFTVEVTCSKGTYIRSLIMDIGQELGCGATMGDLIRTNSGNFSIDNALKLDDVKEKLNSDTLEMLPIQQAIPYPKAYIKTELTAALTKALNGNPIPLDCVKQPLEWSEKYWLMADTQLIGLYTLMSANGSLPLGWGNHMLRPEVML